MVDNSEKELLIIISSKSPNHFLIDNIKQLYKLYDAKICIIDSDSSIFETYDIIRNTYTSNQVDIHLIQNKNYEYGAWKYGYELYPDYKKYMCIQDSICIHKEIDIDIVDDNNAITFFNPSGFTSHPPIMQMSTEFMKDSGLDYLNIINQHFNLATHCTFIVSNNVIKNIFDTLKVPPTNKDGSCAFERIFGLYFILKNITTHDLQHYVSKLHGGR